MAELVLPGPSPPEDEAMPERSVRHVSTWAQRGEGSELGQGRDDFINLKSSPVLAQSPVTGT